MPCMWFEAAQSELSWGAANFRPEPFFMEKLREEILKNPKGFEKAVKSAERAGFVFESEQYSREKPGDCPEKLKKYYNSKDIAFVKRSKEFSLLTSGEIIEKLRGDYKALAPIYKFLLSVCDKIAEE